MYSWRAFSPSLSWPAGTVSSVVDQPAARWPLMSLPSLTFRLTVMSDFANARSRTLPEAAWAAVSGTYTVPDLPVSRATLTSPSVWRSSHGFLPPFIWLANRMYLANPADPAATTKPPPRDRWADSRLSTSEYTACSGPRAGALTGGLTGACSPGLADGAPGVPGSAWLSVSLGSAVVCSRVLLPHPEATTTAARATRRAGRQAPCRSKRATRRAEG